MANFYYPRTWAELRKLPGMRPQPVSREIVKLGELASPQYGMAKSDGESGCGIEECPATHRHGYIVRLRDNSLTHVGKDCARSQLGATDWGRMRSNFTREFGSMAQAKAAYEARAVAEARVGALPPEEMAEVVEALGLLRSFAASPDWFQQVIVARAPQNDRYIEELVPPSQKEVDEARRHAKGKIPPHRKVRVAEIHGLPAFKQQNRVDYLVHERLPAALRALKTVLENDAATARSIGEATNRLAEVDGRIAKSCEWLRRFFSAENLATLPRLPRVREQGFRHLRLIGGTTPRLDFN